MSKEQNSDYPHNQQLNITGVNGCARCGETLTDEMLEEQKDEIEMGCDALCKKHLEDDRLYMADLFMY